MSDTDDSPRKRRRRFLLLAVALVALVAVAAGAATWWLRGGDSDSDYPDAWDPRVSEYAEVVESERGLDFEHPIHVDFLTEDEFKKQVTTDEEKLSDEDREEIERATGLFRALGLIEGDLDMLDTMNQLQQAGIVGYYSHEDERIRIRGTELTPDVRSTIVHELTHALQDQHFDLEQRTQELEEADDSAASSAFQALVEGDARRIETAWREQLGEQERKALDKSQTDQMADFEDDAKDIPDVLETLMAAPYAFGEALLAVATEEGGDEAVDELFESPPTTEEHQLDPWTLIGDREEPLEVAEPELAGGEEKFDDGPFGAISWMLVLAERVPAEQAFVAADGWGGDAFVGFERKGVSCVRAHYQGGSARDHQEMRVALEEWVDAFPGGPASVRSKGPLLVFESCDPGADAAGVVTGSSRDAVSLALTRTYLSATLAGSGLDSAQAQCSADRLVRRFDLEELNSPDADPDRVRQAMAPCLG